MRSFILMEWLRRISRPVILFAAITLIFLSSLAWLSWRVIEQDRAVQRQRWLERCEVAAGNAASQLTRQLADLQHILADATEGRPARVPAEGITLLILRNGFIESQAGIKLPFYPAIRIAGKPLPELFTAAETIEFRDKQPLKAAKLYEQFSRYPDPEVRAAALLRLARTYRKAKLPAKALQTYGALTEMGNVIVEGDPVEMLARLGSAEVYSEMNDAPALNKEAAAIGAALSEGRWFLRRGSYEFLAEDCRQWLGKSFSAEPPAEAMAMASAADALYLQWKDGALGPDSPIGRKIFQSGDRSILVLWNSESSRLSLLCAGPSLLKDTLGRLSAQRADSPRIILEDSDGHRVWGNTAGASELRVVRTASLTGLPWTIYAVPSNPRALDGRLSGQARVLVAALALMLLFALVAAVFVARSISRELAVARLQSDFVAAVSHEFRTPLTTIMQLSEMLVRGRFSSDDRREQFYQTLLGESRRLHGLVENILNFGRLESGKYKYDFSILDLGGFTRDVVDSFTKSAAERGYSVELHCNGEPVSVRGEREALGRALWNLLDNAIKYSPEQKTIWVEVAGNRSEAILSVRDCGLGILPREQKEIFAKFVRGAAARERNIKGTGVGLAMARTIVAAHGGAIDVESVPGKGSTFRIRLPRMEA